MAVILAGGSGSQLYPRSTEQRPKQLIHLLGEGTMIQNTVARLLPVFDPSHIFIVTTAHLASLVKDQVPLVPPENIITEPFRRNTAPSLALANAVLSSRFPPEQIVVAVPSDHVVHNIGEFHESLRTAVVAAQETQGLVTIGLEPTRPETGFGYVQVSDAVVPLLRSDSTSVRTVSVFAEKPDRDTAERFIDAGDFLWNSGMFVYSLTTFSQELRAHLPDYADMFEQVRVPTSAEEFALRVEGIYKQIRPISVDYGIMEKSTRVLCVVSAFEWSDVGTWDEVYRLSKKDSRKNVLEGDVFTVQTKGCLVSSYGKVVGLIGLEDLVVIDSDNLLLICKRGESHRVSELVDLLRRKHINKLM
ncbi:MAG: mannose-1-phosphate guanylyltransferase [Candidatus Kapaibacterium sp.]